MTRPRRPTRSMPEYLLGGLGEDERAALEQEAAMDGPTGQTLEALRALSRGWMDDDREHPSEEAVTAAIAGTGDAARSRATLAHLLDCEDCRLEAAVLRAGMEEEEGGGKAESLPRARRLRSLLAVAALVLAAFLGYAVGGRSARPRATPVLTLGTTRGSDESPSIALDPVARAGLTLIVEARLPAGEALWELRDGAGAVVRGSLGSHGTTGLRPIAVFVPGERLRPGQYVLAVRSADGAAEGQWAFRIRP